jgi:tetratricopeptide (TPR) repeat protein
MPNRSADELFQLIRTLEKGEKRNFKLYMGRNAPSDELKIITLFDAIDKSDIYDEDAILRKNPSIQKQQLSNLKAHLYRQILSSLRLIRNEQSVDMQLHEQLDHARILYNKGLYHQSLKILQKIKELAKNYNQITFWVQALFFEKKIETLHITRSFDHRAEELAQEVNELNDRLAMVGKLSNLALQLYGWYIKMGHVRDEHDVVAVKKFFQKELPDNVTSYNGFYEKLYLFQSNAWYGFILQDFLGYYKNCQRWVDLFEKEPQMIKAEPQHFIKGMHNLLIAHFMLRNDKKFDLELKRFEEFYESKEGTATMNNHVQGFVYLYLAKLNKHFLDGTFSEGLVLVPEIEQKLQEFELQLDRHRTLVFYYKIACLYFGSGDYDNAINYLNRIIHWKADLRSDLQCYARLLHLIAHFEKGNDIILESQVRSVYRFMSKMQNLSVVENEIFAFLRGSFSMSRKELKAAFEQLYAKLKKIEGNPMESRSFMYLDILSWLESKIRNVPVQEVIAEHFKARAKHDATASN